MVGSLAGFSATPRLEIQAGSAMRESGSDSNAMRHEPVMVAEVTQVLGLAAGDTVVDGTLGLAGHSLQFAKLISPGGTILGIDWDDAMLAEARHRLSDIKHVRLLLVRDDYRSLSTHVREQGLKPNGILLDLGLNSAQIDDPERGIAFSKDGPLDMRMDRTRGETAASLLNRMSVNEIEAILWELGDERWARAIARKIVEMRKDRPLRTTGDLVDCVLAAVPQGARDKRIHPATRTFQSVRLAVTRELEGLEEAMDQAAETLAIGGSMAVLSYHSGEDRAVKHSFRRLAESGRFVEVWKKPQMPSLAETTRNPRSRSAKLRAIRRVAE
jgi:16S rRNA (cytosine1402-N4)-methyltransferase